MKMKNLTFYSCALCLLLPFYVSAQSGFQVVTEGHATLKQYLNATRNKNRAIIDIDSIHEVSNGVVYRRHIQNSDYVTGKFERTTLWNFGSGWENIERLTIIFDTTAMRIYDSMSDWDSQFGWWEVSNGYICLNSYFNNYFDTSWMEFGPAAFISNTNYDALQRKTLSHRERYLYNQSANAWGPKHNFDSTAYRYLGNSSEIDYSIQYQLLSPLYHYKSVYSYAGGMVDTITYFLNPTGVFEVHSIEVFSYDPDKDIRMKVRKKWNSTQQMFLPTDSTVYLYYSPPVAHDFHVYILALGDYPWEFLPKTKLLKQIDYFSPNSSGVYTQGLSSVYYYNVPGLSTGNTPAVEQTIFLYPNPAEQEIFITGLKPCHIYAFEIRDIAGKIIFRYNLSGIDSRIDISLLPSGLYICNIVGEGGECLSKKFVKE